MNKLPKTRMVGIMKKWGLGGSIRLVEVSNDEYRIDYIRSDTGEWDKWYVTDDWDDCLSYWNNLTMEH